MIKFEDIKKVNETISTIDVKGKNYAEVNQRIKAFRMLYPAGVIETEILSVENGVCIMKATIKDDNDHILGIGHAYEKENSTFINKTSYIENCETSAVGRALAMCGIGIDTSVASYEEVANAIENQKPKNDKVTEAQKSLIKNNFNIPQVKEYCAISAESNAILEVAFTKLKMSARAYNRILKLSRTIADLEGAENITTEHIMEAISYRTLDKKYWE